MLKAKPSHVINSPGLKLRDFQYYEYQCNNN